MDAPVQLYRTIDPVANWQVGVAIRKAAEDGQPAGEAHVEIYRWQQKTFGPRDVIKFHKMARQRQQGGGSGGGGGRRGHRGRGAAALAKSHAETEWVEAYAAEDDGSDRRLAAIAQAKGEPWLFSTVQEDTPAEEAAAAPALLASDLPGPTTAAELRRGAQALRSGAQPQVMVLKCAVGIDQPAFADGRIPRGTCEEQVLCVARALPHSNLLQMQPGFAHARVNADAAEVAQDAFGSAGLTSLEQLFSRFAPREFRVRSRQAQQQQGQGQPDVPGEAEQRQQSDAPSGSQGDSSRAGRASKQFDTFEFVVFDPNEVGLGVLEEGMLDADTALAQAAAKLRAVDEQALEELEARRGVGAEVHLPPPGEAWCSCSVELQAVEGCEADSLMLHYELVNHAGSGWHVSQPGTPLHEATEAGAVRGGGAVGDFLRTHVEGVTQTAAGRWSRPLQATEEAAIAIFTTPAKPEAQDLASKWSADKSWRLNGKLPWQESARVHHVNCCFDCDMVHRAPAHEPESQLGRALRPPRLLLTAVHVDSWDRTSVVGYAWVDLPMAAGGRTVEVPLSRPQSSVSEEVAGFFLGGAGRLLRHPGTTATGNRFGLQWEAAGVVHIRFDASFQLPTGGGADERSQRGSPTLSAATGARTAMGALTMPRAAAPALGSATSPAGALRTTGRGAGLSLRTTAEVLAASRALRDRAQAFLRPQPAAPPSVPAGGGAAAGAGGGGPPQVQAVDDMRAGGGD